MKIQHTSKNCLYPIRFFLKDMLENSISVELRPGEFVYSETNFTSHSLKIYSKKELLLVTDEEKPNDLEFYKAYEQKQSISEIINSIKEQHSLIAPAIIPTIMTSATTMSTTIIEEKTKLESAKQKASDYKKKEGTRGPGRPKKGEIVKKVKKRNGPGRPPKKKKAPKK